MPRYLINVAETYEVVAADEVSAYETYLDGRCIDSDVMIVDAYEDV